MGNWYKCCHMNNNSIKNIIIEAFNEIFIKYTMHKKTSKKISEGYYEIVFINTTTGLEIHYDVREARLDVDIYRLVNGEIVHNPDFGEWFKTKLNGFDLNYILLYHNSQLCIPSLYKYSADSIYNSNENGFYLYCKLFADRLDKYCSDFLNGNFTNFDKYERFIKNEVKNRIIKL